MCVYGEYDMKEIEFYTDDIKGIKEIAKELFIDADRQNPASIYYERHLERPKIKWICIILQIIIPILTSILILDILLKIGMSFAFSIIFLCFILFFYILICLKKIFICMVHIYQRYAPNSIRMKCRFEPSCSQYMILALEKQGAVKGLLTGFNRIRRCKIGNGGYDFP